MVHQGKGLSFGIEPGQNPARVHAPFDQLQRDWPFHRFGLIRKIDRTHAPLAEDFTQLVTASDVVREHRSIPRLACEDTFARCHNANRAVVRRRWAHEIGLTCDGLFFRFLGEWKCRFADVSEISGNCVRVISIDDVSVLIVGTEKSLDFRAEGDIVAAGLFGRGRVGFYGDPGAANSAVIFHA